MLLVIIGQSQRAHAFVREMNIAINNVSYELDVSPRDMENYRHIILLHTGAGDIFILGIDESVTPNKKSWEQVLSTLKEWSNMTRVQIVTVFNTDFM